MPKFALFDHRHGGCLVQLIICQQNDTKGAAISPPESPHSEAHVSDNSTLTQLDANFSPKSIKNLPAQGLKSSFKHSNDLHAKGEDQGRKLDSKNVSFAADATPVQARSLEPTIIIEQKKIDENSEVLRESTLVRKDLIPPSSLQKLDIFFRYFPEDPNDDFQQFLKVSRILKNDQLNELVRVTKSKILNGEGKSIQLLFENWMIKIVFRSVPWRKLSEVVAITSSHQYDSSEQGLDENGEPKAHAMIMSQTKNDLPRERELENVRNGEKPYDRPLETAVDVDKRHRAVDYGTSEYPTIRSRSMPSRRNSRLDLVYNPGGVVQAPQNRAQRREYPFRVIDREVSAERSRDRPIIIRDRERSRDRPMLIRDRDEDGTFHRPRGWDEFEFSPRKEIVLKRRGEFEHVPTFIREKERSQSLRRPADENFESETSISTRRSERRASPPNRSFTRSDDQRVGQLVLRKALPVSRQLHGRNSASRERVYLQHDGNQPRRFGRSASNRLSRSRSGLRTTAINDHYLDDSDSERHASPLRRNRSALRSDGRDGEIIASTLRSLTTFNNDADNDLAVSPAQLESSGLSDNDEPTFRTLEQATRKLDELYAKLDEATKMQNFMTASNLKFYAIPDVKAEVEEFKVRETKKSKGQEVA